MQCIGDLALHFYIMCSFLPSLQISVLLSVPVKNVKLFSHVSFSLLYVPQMPTTSHFAHLAEEAPDEIE